MSGYIRQLRGMLETIAADISTTDLPVSIGEVKTYGVGFAGVTVYVGIALHRIRLSTRGNTARFREEARTKITDLAAEESAPPSEPVAAATAGDGREAVGEALVP